VSTPSAASSSSQGDPLNFAIPSAFAYADEVWTFMLFLLGFAGGFIVGVVYWAVMAILPLIPMPEPINRVIRVLLIVILVLIVVYALLGLIGVVHTPYRLAY
jgi:hypothetical protein